MEPFPHLAMDQATRYRIIVQGWISNRWQEWCEGMVLSHPGFENIPNTQPDITVLTGVVLDQAALIGLIQRLFTLGFPLLLVECLTSRGESERSTD